MLICRTKDTTAKFTDSGRLLLNHKGHGLKASKPALPEKYKVGNRVFNFKWVLLRTEQKDNAFSVLYYDAKAGFSYCVNVKARRDICGPVEYSAKLINHGGNGVRIIPGTLFSGDFKFDKAPTSWRFAKESGLAEGVHWSKGEAFFDGPGIHKDVISEGVSVEAETNVNQDFNCGGMIPMVYLEGEGYGSYLAVEWSTQRIIVTGLKDGVNVKVDYHKDFTTVIPSGGEFDVAPIYLGGFTGDVDDGSNIFKRWFFKEKTPKIFVNNEKEPLTQIDSQVAPERCKEMGIESIKWDYGWWSNSLLPDAKPTDIWKTYEGSWKLRSEGMINYIKSYGKNTLAEYGQYLKDLGLNWTVYVLLHDSQVETEGDDLLTSVGPNGHPEWFSDRKIAGLCPCADLGNVECVEYIKRKLAAFFTENKIKSWRSDFEPIVFYSNKQNRHDANGNDVQYWNSKGFYDIVDYLYENVPDFRYECCSSGGSMKDFATMRRTTVFNNDDSADFVSLRTTLYDSSYCFPTAQLQSPTDPSTFTPESDKYAKLGDKDFGFRSALCGALMYGSWSGHDETGHLKYGFEDYYKKYFNLYNDKIKHLVRDANLYHVLPRPDSIHWDGMQYGADKKGKDGICGATFIFKPTDTEGSVKHIPVRGLNPDFTYSVEFYDRKEQNFTATGKELMENGIDVKITEPMGSDIIFYICK